MKHFVLTSAAQKSDKTLKSWEYYFRDIRERACLHNHTAGEREGGEDTDLIMGQSELLQETYDRGHRD